MHVLIALASVGVATVTFLKPSVRRLIVSYGFMIATIGSGTFLLLNSTGNILKSCLVGLVYVTIVSIITIATHLRVRNGAIVTQKSE